MKANRFVHNDDAVSPVIAVILMVAITVVLAATVYLWVSGFGANQSQLVQASFGAKAVDLPWANADSDSTDDALMITLVSAQEDLTNSDIVISIDGLLMTWETTTNNQFLVGGDSNNNEFCTADPGNDDDDTWERGASVYLVKSASAVAAATVCDSVIAASELAAINGRHQLTVSVKGQVVLDTTVEVHDSTPQA